MAHLGITQSLRVDGQLHDQRLALEPCPMKRSPALRPGRSGSRVLCRSLGHPFQGSGGATPGSTTTPRPSSGGPGIAIGQRYRRAVLRHPAAGLGRLDLRGPPPAEGSTPRIARARRRLTPVLQRASGTAAKRLWMHAHTCTSGACRPGPPAPYRQGERPNRQAKNRASRPAGFPAGHVPL